MQFPCEDILANFKSKRKMSILQVKEKTIDVEYLKKRLQTGYRKFQILIIIISCIW